MKAIENILTILQVIVGIFVVILVLLQQGKDGGNIVTGSANRGGSMGSSREARLAKLTRIMGAAFVVLTIASNSFMLTNR